MMKERYKAFKGQCIIIPEGYISMFINHQDRNGLYYKNFLLATAEEIRQTLQSCMVWLGRFVKGVGHEYKCEILVRQTYETMEIERITCVLSKEELTLTWSLHNNESKKSLPNGCALPRERLWKRGPEKQLNYFERKRKIAKRKKDSRREEESLRFE